MVSTTISIHVKDELELWTSVCNPLFFFIYFSLTEILQNARYKMNCQAHNIAY